MAGILDELQGAIAGAADTAGPAVTGLGRGWGVGSGVVVAPGRVLTSAHNLRREEAHVVYADGRVAAGRVAALDADLDLAVLEADTADVEPLAWADEGAPAVGAAVIALANPGGRGLRATLGFVSSAPRAFRGPRGRRVGGAIEHTAPLPRGSSGGPLLDAAGRLLGINAVRMEGGLILAVPVAALRERVEALIRGQAPARRTLGVAVAPPHAARRMRRAVGLPEREGVLVRRVQEDSPAARAGVRRGDLIVTAAGRPVAKVDDLYDALDVAAEDQPLALTVVRGTEEVSLEARFAANEEVGS
jgi:serine protease Do